MCIITHSFIDYIFMICLLHVTGDLDSAPIFLRQTPDDCVYEFEWHTAAACVLARKWGSNCVVKDDELGKICRTNVSNTGNTDGT